MCIRDSFQPVAKGDVVQDVLHILFTHADGVTASKACCARSAIALDPGGQFHVSRRTRRAIAPGVGLELIGHGQLVHLQRARAIPFHGIAFDVVHFDAGFQHSRQTVVGVDHITGSDVNYFVRGLSLIHI